MESNSTLLKLTDGISSQKKNKVTSHIEYSGFLDLCKEVESHRAERLITWETFQKYSKDPNTVILDTRSREKFNLRHIEGAVNLPFSEFNANALYKATGYNTENRILIYCNNNFMGDQISMRVKAGPIDKNALKTNPKIGMSPSMFRNEDDMSKKDLLQSYKQLVGNGPSVALNLPTYVTLYGYGFHNVYELADLLHVNDEKVKDHWETNGGDAYYIDGVKVKMIK